MTLAKETMDMNWKDTAGRQSGQILLEGDMIVPDSKPDLQEILRCEGKVTIREKRITDDRLSFSGSMEVTVLYRAKNGERPLYAMKTSLPLEDFLHIEGLEKDMEVRLDTQLEHLDCQIINDRKSGVKAVILVQAEAEQQKHAEILQSVEGEDIECLKGLLQMEQDTASLKDRFTVKEELSLSPSKPEIVDVLWEGVDLTEQDMRAMEGKVMVRGNLKVCMLYCDGAGSIGSFCEKIPFSGYLEGEKIEPKTEILGRLTVEEAKLTPMMDEDGEARQVAVDVTIGAELNGKEAVEQEILQDAYAPRGAVTLEKETIRYPVIVGNGKNQFIVKERIQLEGDEKPMLRAEEVWGEVQLSEARVVVDNVEVEGVLTAEILYDCAADEEPICILRRGIPFGQMMELRGIAEGDEAAVTLRLEDIDFQMLSEREGELRATIAMEAVVTRQETAEVVRDIAMGEEGNEPPMAGAVIYVVQAGDSLWSIAKRYRTTIDDILAVNEIEEPELIYPGQKLLIIKMAR